MGESMRAELRQKLISVDEDWKNKYESIVEQKDIIEKECDHLKCNKQAIEKEFENAQRQMISFKEKMDTQKSQMDNHRTAELMLRLREYQDECASHEKEYAKLRAEMIEYKNSMDAMIP